jgi:colicin import membrane protein
MSKNLAMQENERQLNDVQWDIHEVEESKPLEFTEENKAELFGIEPVKANEMVDGLQTTLSERKVLKDTYIDVIGLEITKENLPTFKELRLKIVKNRTSINKWHTSNKAFYLAGGRFVDAIKNKEILENQEMESKLMEAEKFFENKAKEEKRLINLERIEKIKMYVEDITGLDFSEMNEYDFEDYVLGKKTRFENEAKAKLEAEQKAELERVAEVERQKAIEIENAKLKAEAEAKEKELAKEREQSEKERKIESNRQSSIQAFKDAEIKKLNDEKVKIENERLAKIKSDEKSALLAAKAPIKKQLTIWVDSFNHGLQPVENEKTKNILLKFEAFKKWAKNEIELI